MTVTPANAFRDAPEVVREFQTLETSSTPCSGLSKFDGWEILVISDHSTEACVKISVRKVGAVAHGFKFSSGGAANAGSYKRQEIFKS